LVKQNSRPKGGVLLYMQAPHLRAGEGAGFCFWISLSFVSEVPYRPVGSGVRREG